LCYATYNVDFHAITLSQRRHCARVRNHAAFCRKEHRIDDRAELRKAMEAAPVPGRRITGRGACARRAVTLRSPIAARAWLELRLRQWHFEVRNLAHLRTN
jgi:hypothetical protein